MGTYRLESIFSPNSVAVVGASPNLSSLGGAVFQMIVKGGFDGKIMPINPHHADISGFCCYPKLKSLPLAPDLLVVATPANTVPSIIQQATEAGVKAAIILTAGLGKGIGSLASQTLQIARGSGLRLIGPNCLGVLSPAAKLNASFARRLPAGGPLALITQSGAIAAGVVEWASERNLGFSGVVSIGDAIDVDFGDCLDYYAEDANTRAILLYVEAISDARKFMSAARKASRVKPVVVIKSGRHAEAAKAASTHTGAMAGSDAVYDAAFRRAGCLRVLDLDELFAAAETLATQPLFHGDRLAILTNGGGLGVLAVDKLMDLGGRLASLSPGTVEALDRVLPTIWSHANPVDIIGDAPPDRYAKAVTALLEDKENDAILVMNCPVALTNPKEAAQAVTEAAIGDRKQNNDNKPIFSFWMGADATQRADFEKAGIPSYESEAHALQGIMHLVQYRRRHTALMQTSLPLSHQILPDRKRAKVSIATALADNRQWLSPVEIADLLDAYGIPTTPILLAKSAAEASEASKPILAAGQACVVKIQSRDISHKSDVDGVRLNLATAEAVETATNDILARARRLCPTARIEGVTLQPMIFRPQARELIAGVTTDATFGPLILFGQGGTAVELIDDKALSLLPVNLNQIQELIARTRVSKLLKGYRNVPPANMAAVEEILMRISRLVEDNLEVVGLDLNPLLVDADGAIAIDARVQVVDPDKGSEARTPGGRFAIRPYPRELEHYVQLETGERLLIRPMRPEDETSLKDMLEHVSQTDMRMRFFNVTKKLDRTLIARLTQLDYAREMALVAIDPATQNMLGVARLYGDANHVRAEYAILVRSDWQGRGLGYHLMQQLINFAKDEGYHCLEGQILADNQKMLKFCRAFGFLVEPATTGDARLSRLILS